MVLALIEDIRGVERLDAILAVDGIDVLFIGPSDLAQSMGYPGRPDQPEVRAAIDRVIARGVAAGRVVGLNAPSAAVAMSYAERGVRCFSLGPWHHLVAAWRDYLANVPGRAANQPP
jgi:4-hydroxy-2-oxoheptanedioate aldolase